MKKIAHIMFNKLLQFDNNDIDINTKTGLALAIGFNCIVVSSSRIRITDDKNEPESKKRELSNEDNK